MRLPRLSLSSVVDDIFQIFGKRLLCDWQSEPTICDDVLVSSFSAIMPVQCKSLSIQFDADPCNTLPVGRICACISSSNLYMYFKIKRT